MAELTDLHFPGFYFSLVKNFAANRGFLIEQFQKIGLSSDLFENQQSTFNGEEAQQLLKLAKQLATTDQPLSIDLLDQIDFEGVIQLAMSISNAKTLRDIHKTVADSCSVLMPPGMLVISFEPDQITYTVNSLADFGEETHCLIELFLGFFYYVQRTLQRNSVEQLRMEFSFQPPYSKQTYKNNLRCEIQFNAKRNTIIFPKSVIDLPLPSPEIIGRHPIPAFTLPLLSSVNAESLSDRARASLTEPAKKGIFLDKEQLALELSMSVRTLSRKLQSEGTSFTELQQRVKITLAKDLLAQSNKRVSSIAEMTGYSSEAGFTRAFKKATGVSPTDYRDSHREIEK